ncbi:hypothetical protein ACVBGC_26310 [Burkholderia stagnalis]
MRPIEKFVASVQGSWIARTLILSASFLVPFVWGLSTDLIWAALKNISRITSDASINLPTAMPWISCMVGAWVACFLVVGRIVKSTLRATLASNVVAVIVFVIGLTLMLGTSDWKLVSGDLVSIFPIRFAVAVLISFALSIWTARIFEKAGSR